MDFRPLALKAVRQAMIDAGLARTTINQRVGRIVRLFKWAVENELVPPTVHQALKAVRGLQKGRSSARETKPVKPWLRTNMIEYLFSPSEAMRADRIVSCAYACMWPRTLRLNRQGSNWPRSTSRNFASHSPVSSGLFRTRS